MASLNSLGRQILEVLRTRLMPWVEGGAPFILLDAPPKLIGTNTIIEQPGPKLPVQHGRGQNVRTQWWAEENLNTMTTPYMGCVIEGEADITIGTTTAMCRRLKIPGKRWIVRAPQQSIFIAPPQTPISSGSRPHWERPHPERAYSRILWIQFHSSGIRCHFCSSDKGIHRTHPFYFIHGTKFLPLAETLIDEMTTQSPQYLPIVYHNLANLLHHTARGLMSRQDKHQAETAISPSASYDSADELIQRATDFIDQHLYDYPLSLENIAAHLHLSPRHLGRIFQREAHSTVMQLVTKRRMQLAGQLLIESQFSVIDVAEYCGYASPSSFIKAFIRHFGVSPADYRAVNRLNVQIEQ
jgi:AraC-like DNA-binding protein